MRFLYVGIDPVDFSSELFRQDVVYKVGGVRQMGNQADYICRDGASIVSCIGNEKRQVGFLNEKNSTHNFCSYVLNFLHHEDAYDFLYLKSRLLHSDLAKLAAVVKNRKFGAKVIYEPTAYPFEEMYHHEMQQKDQRKSLLTNLNLYGKLLRQRANKIGITSWADSAVSFELPVHSIYGVPAVSVSRGTCVSKFHVRAGSESLEDPITILAVVEDPLLCGFERLFRGLDQYCRNNTHREPITLDVAGRKEDLEPLRAAAEQSGMSQCVNFIELRNMEQLNGLCCTHTIAASNLGLYKSGTIYNSPYLTKLFCAAGIPFIYAYEDVGLGREVPFAMKLPNFDAPVNMELVSGFAWRCRFNAGLVQQERRFAEEHFDWRIIMKRILLFTVTGKLEV